MIVAFEHGQKINEIVQTLPQMEIQHMRRVSNLVTLFTKRLYNQECGKECTYFGQAAFYHDIGKAWVPKEILMKPGRLTEKEKKIICQHPLFAKEILDQMGDGLIPGFPLYFAQWIMQTAVYHHEWWDGTGYPYGKKQDAIPFIARITSICDAYDAMSSDRVYRKAHAHAYVCEQLKKNAGIQFDPGLTGIFLDSASEFAAMNQNSLDQPE